MSVRSLQKFRNVSTVEKMVINQMNVKNLQNHAQTAARKVIGTKNVRSQRNQLYASIVIKKVMVEVTVLNLLNQRCASTAEQKVTP